MDAIKALSQLSLPALPKVSVPVPSAPALPQEPPPVEVEASAFDAQLAQQQRVAAVERAAVQIANTKVLGSRSFTIFKDITGQYVTRFYDKDTGKVSYEPEPPVLSESSGAGAIINISA